MKKRRPRRSSRWGIIFTLPAFRLRGVRVSDHETELVAEIGRCYICVQTFATQDDLSKHLMEAHAARALKALNELAERYGKQFMVGPS